jgi:tripeptide aminopeptidase
MLSDALQLRGVKDAMQWISREKQWINEIHLQLCRVPAPTFLEQARAEWVSAQFRQMGCHTHMDRSGNVVATLGPAGDGPYIAVTAHLDTVFAWIRPVYCMDRAFPITERGSALCWRWRARSA